MSTHPFQLIISNKDKKIHPRNIKSLSNERRSRTIDTKYVKNFLDYTDLLTLNTKYIYEMCLNKELPGGSFFYKMPDELDLWVLEYKEFYELFKNSISLTYLPKTKGQLLNKEGLKRYLNIEPTKNINIIAKIKKIHIMFSGNFNELKFNIEKQKELPIIDAFIRYQHNDCYSDFVNSSDYYVIDDNNKKIMKRDPLIKKIDSFFEKYTRAPESGHHPAKITFDNLIKLNEFCKTHDISLSLTLRSYNPENKINFINIEELLSEKNSRNKKLLLKIMDYARLNKPMMVDENRIYVFDFKQVKDLEDKIIKYLTNEELKNFLETIKKGSSLKNINENYIKNIKNNGLKTDLYDHQKLACSWLLNLYNTHIPGAILADDMGLGKSLSSIAFLSYFKNKDVLIVAPASVVGSWENEIQNHNPSILKHNKIKIISYEKLLRENISKTDILILDEAQKIKNNKTKMFKKINSIIKEFTIIVTGTPIENKIDDLFSLLQIIDESAYDLLKILKQVYKDDALIASRIREIIDNIYLQRKKSDVNLEGLKSELKIKNIFIDPTSHEIYLFNKIRQIFHDKLLRIEADNNHDFYTLRTMLTGLLRLRQAISYPKQLPDELIHHLDKKSKVLLNNDPSKAKELVKIYKEIKSRNEKVVIFTEFLSTNKYLKDLLAKNGAKVLTLTGNDSSIKRKMLIKEFQENDTHDVFLISLKAGNAGITLHSANNVIIYDLWYNPQVVAQAVARVHRIGQNSDVNAYFLILNKSIDKRIYDIFYSKQNLIKMFENPEKSSDASNINEKVINMSKDIFT